MFEIGNSLREARVRRGVDFGEAELATKIRGKYLRALEEEQFSLLPAQTYVKGFLRTYAEYLGLDGQLYVDEYNSRFVSGEEHEPRARRSTAAPPRRNRRVETNVVLIALAVIGVLTVVVISAWKASGGKGGGTPTVAGGTHTSTGSRIVPPLLELRATTGSTHVIAHRGGTVNGNLAYDGTISAGDPPVAIRGSKTLWVSLDSPSNVQIRVRGHLVHVPGSKPQVILVTATGWRPAGS